MACLPIPTLPIPTLPAGIGISFTLPPITFDPALCCKILPFPLSTPPIPIALGVAIPPAINAAIASAISSVQQYLDQLVIHCPREGGLAGMLI